MEFFGRWHVRIKHTFTSTIKALAGVTMYTLALTACGSTDDGRSYSLPDNICGITVDSEILAQLLDDGDELVQDANSFSRSGSYICHMYVDGNDSVVSDANWHESGYTLREYFEYSNIKGVRYVEGGSTRRGDPALRRSSHVPESAKRATSWTYLSKTWNGMKSHEVSWRSSDHPTSTRTRKSSAVLPESRVYSASRKTHR